MRLCAKHILHPPITLHLILGIFRKEQIQVLQRLGKPKALHFVDTLHLVLIIVGLRLHHVPQPSEPPLDAVHALQRPERLPRPLLPLRVARGPVRVVQALDGLGPEDELRVGRPEAAGTVEEEPLCRRRPVGRLLGELLVLVLPAERLGADAAGGLAVDFVVRLCQLEAEVDKGLVLQEEAAEDEGAAADACHYYEIRRGDQMKMGI